LTLSLPAPSADVGPFSLAPASDIPLEPIATATEAAEPVAFVPVAEAAPVVAPVAPPVTMVAPATPVAVAQTAAPQVETFELPLNDLHAIAQTAGLQWVNSDSAKVQAIRDAIAQEAKPVHVPRERPPVVIADEGPLVLVETRKDLSQIKLPFESAAR
jgi:ribonuclease E